MSDEELVVTEQETQLTDVLEAEPEELECAENFMDDELLLHLESDDETPDEVYSLDDVLESMLTFTDKDIPARYSCDEIGFGYIFADCFRKIARYVPERKKWFVFANGKWSPDFCRVAELCKKLAAAILDKVRHKYCEYMSKEDWVLFSRWETRYGRESIIKDAASVYPVRLSEFDTDPYIFNCTNGTLNLQDMTFHEHRPEDMLSKMSGVAYNPNARCDRWERHMREIMLDNQDKIEYLQKALGYALTGLTIFELFFILFGPKFRNGKGSTMETFLHLMGDYGCSTKPETVSQKLNPNGSAPSEDIARLAGKRFANISEPDENMILSSALVKTLTGRDKITARFLNENSFEFYPVAKLFINTNHLPKVTDATVFSSDRVKVLLFERYFEEHERDTGLKDELTRPENLSGILNWCIEGWKMLQQNGFAEPQCVTDAVNSYRVDSDKVGMFFSEMMAQDANGEASMTDTYEAYKGWCVDNGYKYKSVSLFKKSLPPHAEIRRKRPAGAGRSANPISCICGYKLLAPVSVPITVSAAPEETQEAEEGA